MRGDIVPEAAVYYWRAALGVHQPRPLGWVPKESFGAEGSNLWVSYGAIAIKCAKDPDRMASPAETEMREIMRLGAEDPDSGKTHGPPPRQQDLTGQQPPTTEKSRPTPPKEQQERQTQNNNNDGCILNHRSRCRQNNHHQHSNNIVEVLRLKLKESAKRGEREARCSSQVWCLSKV